MLIFLPCVGNSEIADAVEFVDEAGHNMLPPDDGKSGGIFDWVGDGFCGGETAEEIEQSVIEKNADGKYSECSYRSVVPNAHCHCHTTTCNG